MNRSIKRAAVLLTVLGMSCLPGTAIADARGAGTTVVGDGNQVAGGDIFNAGHDNIVGSGDVGGGVGAGAPSADKVVLILTIEPNFFARLVSHTGDAVFPELLVGAIPGVVRFTTSGAAAMSTAVYDGGSAAPRYALTLLVSADGTPTVSCTPVARCRVSNQGDTPIVTMS
ncbi:hypothetical protein ABIA33_006832 [Streptacidiphilus sp. MAP12-16]|uniref:hypothetical protein n=1 Tax=Streptacidiphilus sp. MAP12-16 TaxID=3156300 RepID=UPI003513E75F